MNKTKSIAASVLIISSAAAHGAVTYSTDFEEPPFDPTGDVRDQDGWIIDTAVDDVSFFVSYDSDGPSGNPASQAGALGGLFDTPGGAGTQVNLTHSVDLSLATMSFDVDFAVIESTVDFPGADNFGFSFSASGVADPLFRIAFEGPASGLGDLEIVWYDNLGVRNQVAPVAQAISYSAASTLSIDFTPSNGGTDASFTATVASATSVTFSGTVAGQGMAAVDAVGVDFDVVENGDNYIIFDNLAAVPEPSVTLLLFASLAGLVGLRRRRG